MSTILFTEPFWKENRMSCGIEHDRSSWIEDDLAEAAQIFAAHCDEALPGESFTLRIGEEDSQGWLAYLYGQSNYGKEITAMIGRGTYHFEDTFFLDDADEETLSELVEEFAASLSGDGCAFNVST